MQIEKFIVARQTRMQETVHTFNGWSHFKNKAIFTSVNDQTNQTIMFQFKSDAQDQLNIILMEKEKDDNWNYAVVKIEF